MANRSPKKPVATQSAAGAQQRVAGHAAELGQGVQSHLKAHMSERIGQMVSHDLAPRISESVASHLGNATPVTTAATVAQVPEHPLLSELRQPQTLQRAMVASLILAPPRALANRR
jgi:microcompartment protein CcmL/EutN